MLGKSRSVYAENIGKIFFFQISINRALQYTFP
jgi:hypothetical protein